MKNDISFLVHGRYALFSDPITRLGGEKCTYHIPTYEALKGIVKSIYWKPTLIWFIDRVRVLNQFRTQSKGMKPLKWHESGNELSIYTYLVDVAYEVQAHFEWNTHRPELAHDRIDGKHYEIARRMLARGGRQDIFLGTRECQGYVEPCVFGKAKSDFDKLDELSFNLMFHGFDYPDETGENVFHARFWKPVMRNGEIVFPRPEEFPAPGEPSYEEDCKIRKFIRPMRAKEFKPGANYCNFESDEELTHLLLEPETPYYPDARALLQEEKV